MEPPAQSMVAADYLLNKQLSPLNCQDKATMTTDINDISALSCWIVTDGKAGTENQCIGLANALGVKAEIKRVQLRAPWRWLTPYVKGFEEYAFSRKGSPIKGPWPQLLIASGRRSLPAVFAARRAMGDKITIIQLQDPKCDLSWFDLVAAPKHDMLEGPNVIQTLGALNKITPAQIETASNAQAKRFAGLAQPLISVIIGGTSAAYTFDEKQMTALVQKLEQLLWKTPGSLLITPSRRTGDANLKILKNKLGNHPRVWIWDFVSENPYFAMLGLAEIILVTGDSVSMISEAATTGKPLYVIPLEGGNAKFERFHKNFLHAGITRVFNGQLDLWNYDPLRETEQVAVKVKEIIQKKQAKS